MKSLWVEIDSGRVYTRKERDRILMECFEFDEFTPSSEVYEYFCKVSEVNAFDVI